MLGKTALLRLSVEKKGLRERGRLWTPRVKYMFGQHLHSVEYLMLPFSSAVEGVSALILNRV